METPDLTSLWLPFIRRASFFNVRVVLETMHN